MPGPLLTLLAAAGVRGHENPCVPQPCRACDSRSGGRGPPRNLTLPETQDVGSFSLGAPSSFRHSQSPQVIISLRAKLAFCSTEAFCWPPFAPGVCKSCSQAACREPTRMKGRRAHEDVEICRSCARKPGTRKFMSMWPFLLFWEFVAWAVRLQDVTSRHLQRRLRNFTKKPPSGMQGQPENQKEARRAFGGLWEGEVDRGL